jgi:hypothetical protein
MSVYSISRGFCTSLPPRRTLTAATSLKQRLPYITQAPHDVELFVFH